MKVEINGNVLEMMTGDITEQQTDAIVNAANGSLMGGGGVDGAIHRKAGKELLEECKKVRKESLHGEYLPTGEAVITKGYQLPAAYVIHTVGPVWDGNTEEKERLLANCYSNSLTLAKEKELTSISFPSISTGVYRFPVELAATTALQTLKEFLSNDDFGTVKMILFSEEDYNMYTDAFGKIK